MRVIAGQAKGHKLQTLPGLATRPTLDRIKESLFSSISADLPGCLFLDLFSGSGAIGIEALSRGAAEAVFVEENKEAIAIIKENLNHTKLTEKAIIYGQEVTKALFSIKEQGTVFDIIFMDPPYKKGLEQQVLAFIQEHKLLSENGYVIVEHATEDTFLPIEGFYLVKEKKYKTTTISFLSI